MSLSTSMQFWVLQAAIADGPDPSERLTDEQRDRYERLANMTDEELEAEIERLERKRG